MKNRFVLALLLTIIMGGIATAAQKIYEEESWPYEGMPYFEVVKDKVELHKTASSASSIVEIINMETGSAISFKNGVAELIKRRKKYGTVFGIKDKAKINSDIILGKSIQRTIEPGIIRAMANGSAQSFTFKKGDVIEELMLLGEGACLYRHSGKIVVNETCLYEPLKDGRLVRESDVETEWWVTIEQNGKTIGWLQIDDNAPLRLIETIK